MYISVRKKSNRFTASIVHRSGVLPLRKCSKNNINFRFWQRNAVKTPKFATLCGVNCSITAYFRWGNAPKNSRKCRVHKKILQGQSNFATLRGHSYSAQRRIAAPKMLRKRVESLHFRSKMPQSHRKIYFAPLPGVRCSTLHWGGPPLKM